MSCPKNASNIINILLFSIKSSFLTITLILYSQIWPDTWFELHVLNVPQEADVWEYVGC